MADAEDVRRIALSLPKAVENDTAYEVGGKGFVWFYREKVDKKSPRVLRWDALAVRVPNLEEKAVFLAADPEKFFTTDHYNGYPAVLVRLPAIDTEELRELLIDAWRTRAPRRLLEGVEFAPCPPRVGGSER